jgi:predicted transcriptional regulator YheO
MSTKAEHEWLLGEAAKIVDAIAATFAPMCEVVLHDLTCPDNAIIKIANNLSGREIGGPATEMGLARIADPKFPDVVSNYPNTLSDGRAVKSTSIGLRDSDGNFVASICMNIDVSYIRATASYLTEFAQVRPSERAVAETLAKPNKPDLQAKILAFAGARNKDPRALTADDKRVLVQRLAEEGDLERRGAVEQIANEIGVSRSNLYYYLRKPEAR